LLPASKLTVPDRDIYARQVIRIDADPVATPFNSASIAAHRVQQGRVSPLPARVAGRTDHPACQTNPKSLA
jgi:hypothetical protein